MANFELLTFDSANARQKRRDSNSITPTFIDAELTDLPASPSNYSPADDLVSSHLAAIDSALGNTVAADENVKVSANDTTTGFLADKLVSSDSSITFTQVNDGGDEDLSLVVNPANVDHDALENFVANEHVDHSAVSVLAGGDDGLSASNDDLTTNIGLSVDIDGTTAETSVQDADTILIHDDSAGALRKMTRANFVGGAELSMQSNKITNLGTPTADTDAVTKLYADSLAAGLDPKESVRLATTADLGATYNSSGGAGGTGQFTGAPTTIDGVAIAQGDRILVKNQSTQTENGIYVVTATTTVWDRAGDMDGSPANEVSGGNFTFVEQGTANQGRGYTVIGDGTLTLNTDNIVWSAFSATTVTGGDGIEVTGNEVAVDLLASGGLKFVSAELAVEPADFAGTGLEDDGSDNLRIAAAAAGNGLTGGAGSALAVEADSTGGANLATVIAVSANGVAVAIDDSSIGENGSNQLEVKDDGIATAKIADGAVTAEKINSDVAGLGLEQASDGSLQSDSVDTLQNDDAAAFVAREFGVMEADGNVVKANAQTSGLNLGSTFVMALEGVNAAASGNFAVGKYKLGGFSGLNEEQPVFLNRTTAGGYTQSLSGFVAGEHVVLLGQAISSTEIIFDPRYITEF